jgi:hypothetical protein
MRKSLLAGLAVVLSFPAFAYADLSYTQTTTGVQTTLTGSTKTITMVKGDVARVETEFFGNPIVILTWANGDITQFAPDSKIVTVSKKSDVTETKDAAEPAVEMDVKVLNLGVQTLRGAKAAHWRVDFAMTLPGNATSPASALSTEIWSSTTPFPQPARTSASSQDLPIGLRAMVAGDVKVKGDLKGISAAYATVPLRTKASVDGKVLATAETSDISTKPLPASLFTVPEGYREVSQDEWRAWQTSIIQKGMASKPIGLPAVAPPPA